MNVAQEIASSAVRFLERTVDMIPAEARNPAPARIGLAPERVRQLLAIEAIKATPLSAEQVRRSLARSTRAARVGHWGRRGLPEYIWRAMYVEYQAGKSCAEVAAIFGGTRQSVHEVFKARRLPLRPRHPRLHAKIEYRGRSFTPGKAGYYRATCGDREPLHHAMWIDAHGPIPHGWQVAFRNADLNDVRLENLFCAPIAAVTSYHQARLKEEAA